MNPKSLILAAIAAFTAVPAMAVDIDAGRQLTYTCTGCHGVTGYKNAYPNYNVPLIAGQNHDYLVIALKAYKDGVRKHPTMRAQGEGLTETEIEQIATYLAGLRTQEAQ